MSRMASFFSSQYSEARREEIFSICSSSPAPAPTP